MKGYVVCLVCNASLICLTGTMSMPIECVICGRGEISVLNQVTAHEAWCRMITVPKECPQMGRIIDADSKVRLR